MKLYLDTNEGAGFIPCPRCHSPMLIGYERRGRLFVGYGRGVFLWRGARALLVCCHYECDHQEEVEIAATPDDAVVFSSLRASGLYRMHVHSWDTTVDEQMEQIRELQALHRRTGREKLLCALRFLQQELERSLHRMRSCLVEASRSGRPVSVHGGTNLAQQGRVLTTTADGVLLDCADGETRLIRLGDLSSVGFLVEARHDSRFDFGDISQIPRGAWAIHSPRSFVEIGGHTFVLNGTTAYGLCFIQTTDPEVAAELKLWRVYRDRFVGECPAALVDRCYLQQQYCWVQGHRLWVDSLCRNPDFVLLETRDMATARALRMHYQEWHVIGSRQQLRWWRHFRWSEIDRLEEIRIPRPLPRRRR